MFFSILVFSFLSRQAKRSSPDALFTHDPFIGGFLIGSGGGPGPHIVRGRFTYTTRRVRPRGADGAQPWNSTS